MERFQTKVLADEGVDEEDAECIVEVIRAFEDEVKRVSVRFLFVLLSGAIIRGHSRVMELLVESGLRVDLDFWLTQAILEGDSQVADTLCSLGGGPVQVHFWDNPDRVALYGILIEHNLMPLELLFYQIHENIDFEGLYPEPLAVGFDVSGDRCSQIGSWMGRLEFIHTEVGEEETDERDLLEVVRLFASNVASVYLWPPVSKLPKLGPKLSAVLRTMFQPPSLQSICRKEFRRIAPQRNYQKWVRGLGIPFPLVDYLCSSRDR